MKDAPLLPVVAALLLFAATAAIPTPAAASAPEHRIGVVGGALLSSLDSKTVDSLRTDFDGRTDFGIGALLDLNTHRSFHLRFEPMFLRRGADKELRDAWGGTIRSELTLDYIELPVLFVLSFDLGWPEAYGAAGGYGAFLLSAEEKFLCDYGRELFGDSRDVSDDMEDLDYGYTFGAGVRLPLGGISLFAEAFYEKGLADLWKGETPPGDPEFAEGTTDLENEGWKIQGGVTFTVGQKDAAPEEAPAAERPARPESLCGPDITLHMLKVLDRMTADYLNAPDTTQRKACENLLSMDTAEFAWDIIPPKVAAPAKPLPGRPYWFQGICPPCATPFYPCAPTVEFLGYCMHSQVVNYIQWGAMNSLCGNETQAAIAHMGRATYGARWSSLETKTPYYEEQNEMVRVGEEFVQVIQRLYRDPDVLNDPGYYTPEKVRELAAVELRRGMENRIGGGIVGIDWNARTECRCKLPCVLDAAAKRRLDQWPWDYYWLGLTDENRSDRYERRAQPDEEEEEGN